MSTVPDLPFIEYRALKKILSENGMNEKNLLDYLREEYGMSKDSAYFSVRRITKNLREKSLIHTHTRPEILYTPTDLAIKEFPKIKIQEDSEVDPLKLYISSDEL